MSSVFITSTSPICIVAFGVLLRILFAVLATPQPSSDGAAYMLLADKLASGEVYVDEAGKRAFWPPGYPFYLTPFFIVLGRSVRTVCFANLCLYMFSSAAIYSLSKQLFDKKVAVCAVFLLAIWPNQIFATSFPMKENLAITAILIALACLAVNCRRPYHSKAGWCAALVGGGSLALGSLTQPGLTLLGPLLPLAYRDIMLKRGPYSLTIGAATTIGFALIISPWIIRNYKAFDGQFVGISTNGGSTFYRSNNELATGVWIQRGKRSLDHLGELEANEKGREWGLQWIKEHPVDALKLSVRKAVFFVASDDYGSYWAIFRGLGKDHDASQAELETNWQRRLAFKISRQVSNAFWLVMLAAIVLGLAKVARVKVSSDEISPLIYPFLYLMLVHSIFESGDRHHMVPFAVLLVFAAVQFVHSTGSPAFITSAGQREK